MRDDELADRPADVSLSAPERLADGFRPYQRFHLTLRSGDGTVVRQERDVLRGGKVIAVLPVDIERDEIVLIRQFRLPAHLAGGNGDLIEIVAGRVEDGEQPIVAARRECEEEIGVQPRAIVELFNSSVRPASPTRRSSFFSPPSMPRSTRAYVSWPVSRLRLCGCL